MSVLINITSVFSTNEPYQVWVCDDYNENANCIYIESITDSDIPYSFNLPNEFNNINYFCIKLIDNESCVHYVCDPPIPSQSSSPTPTTTPSNTVTPSVTQTPSLTQTPSSTQTPSGSVTPSVTQTPSTTATPSVTQTPTSSVTPSITQTPSITATPSVTQTPSNSATPSVTQTPSNTATPSVTQTPSNTITPSVTQTPSNTTTPSVTQTPSNTATPSVTQTPSNTATPSVTQTPSNTATPSVTQTPSNTATPSVTQTPSNTATPSVTQTPSNTTTPSVTQTPSNTTTPSNTATPSVTQTPSVTTTPSTTPNAQYKVSFLECCQSSGGTVANGVWTVVLTGATQTLNVGDVIPGVNADGVTVGFEITGIDPPPNPTQTVYIGDSDIFSDCDEAIEDLKYVCYTRLLQGCVTGTIYGAFSSGAYQDDFETDTVYYSPTAFAGGDYCATAIMDGTFTALADITTSTATVVNNCSNLLCDGPSPSVTPTPSVTQTPSNTATPSVTQTPSNTATPSVTQTPSNTTTPSVTPTPPLDYFRALSQCCDSTDSPITGSIAVPSSYGFSEGDYVVINEHAYILGGTDTSGTLITSALSSTFGSCEAAVSAAVAAYGNSSGCRYTFSGCCPNDSVTYIEPFSIQGADPSTTILPSYILPITSNWGLVNTTASPELCAIKYTYNSSVSFDNSRIVDDGYTGTNTEACGTGRCNRCVYVVSPCSDPSESFNLVVTSGDLLGSSVGDVYNGSNIHGNTTLDGGAYTVTGNCVTILNTSTTPTLSGSILNASDAGDTISSVGSGCSSVANCPECATNFKIQNYNTISVNVTYNHCDGTSDSVIIPALNPIGSLPGEVVLTDCVDISTLNLPTNVAIFNNYGFDYCV